MRPVPRNYMFCCERTLNNSKEGPNSWLGANFTAPSLVLLVLDYNITATLTPDLFVCGFIEIFKSCTESEN